MKSFEFYPVEGRVEATALGYLQPISGLAPGEGRIQADLGWGASNERWGARIAPVLSLWIPSAGRGYLDLKEAWAEAKFEAWEIRAGNQVLHWGASDRVNPTNVWNPVDATDPFLMTQLPLPVARLRIHPPAWEAVSLELVATPFFRPTLLPLNPPDSGSALADVNSSRWLLPLPTAAMVGAGTVPLSYSVLESALPDRWQAGARLTAATPWDWDFSIAYFNGVERLPRLHFTASGTPSDPAIPITVTVDPRHFRMQMLGADLAGSFGESGLSARAEAAYLIRDNSGLAGLPAAAQANYRKDDALEAAIGADYQLPVRLGAQSYVNLLFVMRQQFGGQQAAVDASAVQGLPNVLPWDRNLVLSLRSRFSDRWQAQATGLWSLQNGDAYVSVGPTLRWSDHLSVNLLGEGFFGSLSGFYGQFHENSRVRTGIAMGF